MVKRLPERKLDRGAQTTDGYEVRFLTSYKYEMGREVQTLRFAKNSHSLLIVGV